MNKRKLYASLLVCLVFSTVFLLKRNFTVELYQDEFHYLPTAVFFSHEAVPSVDLLKSYNELNTPVPFILGGWVVAAFGENIQNLRLLTFLVSFVLLMLFIWNSPANSERFWIGLGGLVAFPNYYLCSVYYYTDIFAMAFVLAGLAAYLKKVHWAALLFFIGAVSCRQYMLAFPASIAAFEMIRIYQQRGSLKSAFPNLFSDKTWIYYVIAVLSIIPWFVLWQGPAPAAVMAQQHYDSDKLVVFNMGYVLYASVCIAFYYIIPETLLTRKVGYFLDYPRNYPRLFIVLLLLVAVLVIYFPARQAYNPYFTWPYLGYIDQFLMMVGITGILKQLIFGLCMLVTLMRFITPAFNLAAWMVVFNTLLLGKAQLSWDKYSLPLIMALWFLFLFNDQWSLFTYTKKDVATTAENDSRKNLSQRI